MVIMPRRKQDTPQRLKLKTLVELPQNQVSSNGDVDLAEEKVKKLNDLRTEIGTETDQIEHKNDHECEEIDDQELTENMETTLRNQSKAYENTSINRCGEKGTMFNTSDPNPQCTSNKPKTSQNGIAEDKRLVQEESSISPRSYVSEDDCAHESNENSNHDNDTSLLHTLAAAAVFRSTTPTTAVEYGENLVKTIRSDSSMPIKKRAKRSPTPTTSETRHMAQSSVKTLVCSPEPTKSHESSSPQQTLSPETAYAYDNGVHLDSNNMQMSLPSEKMNTQQQATQLHLMEAMMRRQRQLYEECSDNGWMKMQRSDNNCLSKSKAERYRWCVQENIGNGKSVKGSPTNEKMPTGIHSNVANTKKISSATRSSSSMQDKLYSTVFTGASKFRCRDCGSPFNTLVDLTVHMSKTGHYRDLNVAEEMNQGNSNSSSNFVKPKKRSMMEMDEKESPEKVLKCLGCGHSFDSLQDLSVHMIKTKHYEDIPSLRYYGQKNDFCALNYRTKEEKITPLAQVNNNNIATANNVHFDAKDVQPVPTDQRATSDHEALDFAARSSLFGGIPNLANLHAYAAHGLLGFPPYTMPMPFMGAMNNYGAAHPALAAAASLFLSAPWLAQMPGVGASNMMSPFMNPHMAYSSSLFPHPSSVSPAAQNHSSPPLMESFSNRSNASPHGSKTPQPGRITRCSEEVQRSKSQVLRCFQCDESFSSLQKLTNHMQESTHFPDHKLDKTRNFASPARSETLSPEQLRDGNSTALQRDQNSPITRHSYSNSLHSSTATPTFPTSSPLEHLAKLASGTSMSHVDGGLLRRPSANNKSIKSESIKAISQNDLITPSMFPCSKSVPSEDSQKAKRKESPQCSVKTGFDFIKSIETTIQSAISKVNESPSSERKRQSLDEQASTHKHQHDVAYFHGGSSFKPFRSSISPTMSNDKVGPQTSRLSPKIGLKDFRKYSSSTPSRNNIHSNKNRRPLSDSEISSRLSPLCASQNREATKPVQRLESRKVSDIVPRSSNSSTTTNNNRNSSTANHERPSPSTIPCRPKISHDVSSDEHDTAFVDPCAKKIRLANNPLEYFKDNMQNLLNTVTSQTIRLNDISAKSHSPPRSSSGGESEQKMRFPVDAMNRKESAASPTRHTPPTASRIFPTQRDYMSISNGKEINPLAEIQKIVNSTELTRRPESLTDLAAKDDKSAFVNESRKRTAMMESSRSDLIKRYKPGSVLSDLVVHDDQSPLVMNPLAQMENLVNVKIGENLSLVQKGLTSQALLSQTTIKNSNLAKSHVQADQNGLIPKCPKTFQHGTNPMSALLNFFDGANGLLNMSDHKSTSQKSNRSDSNQTISKRTKRNRTNKPIPTTLNEKPIRNSVDKASLSDHTDMLRNKMADFFRSMSAQKRSRSVDIKRELTSPTQNGYKPKAEVSEIVKKSVPGVCDEEERRVCSPCTRNPNLSAIQESLLQFHYVSHLDRFKEGFDISENDLAKISKKTELPVDDIKKWISETRQRLLNEGENNFIRLPKSNDDNVLLRCTLCDDFSEMSSVEQFLQHLDEEHKSFYQTSQGNKTVRNDGEKKDWKMMYKGEMSFQKLTSGSNTYSVRAHVTETSDMEKQPMRDLSPSPTEDTVSPKHLYAEGLKVTDDSPIQVSG